MTHHELETAFSIDTSAIKFGPGVTREIGYEVARMGAKRVMIVTDPRMARLEPVAVVLDSLRAEGIDPVLFDQVEVEPTDKSFKEAIEFASNGGFDAFVSVGGGVEHRHRKGRQPILDAPSRLPDIRQRANWAGRACTGPSEASRRGADDIRHRFGDDRRGDIRPA